VPVRRKPTTAPTAPVVTVSPSHGLRGGDTVHISATGIAPSASVQVIQCDTYSTDPDENCSPTTTTAADPMGSVSLHMTVASVVYQSQDIGDSVPIYCRADGCRIFLAWTDADGVAQVASSRTLEFAGAPARIHARPSSALTNNEKIRVNGSAYGAFGHRVEVFEEACYDIAQGSGCYGALPAVTTWISPNGTFAVHYRAKRFLADGTDCTSPDILGGCEMTVVVLTHGLPDDSFGVSAFGQPAAPITFAP
jgi:neocarzinostatin family protein